MSKMIQDERGVATNCFGAAHRKTKNECTVMIPSLKWYNGRRRKGRCNGCTFFKTCEEYEAGFNGNKQLKDSVENWKGEDDE